MIKCVIIDDERPARELIQRYLLELPEFSIMASFDNGASAVEFIKKNTVDLVFLDIKMPGISGLQLMQSLPTQPAIILTTAYREFAVEAFELEALDYLVKPITPDRFTKAITKFLQLQENEVRKADAPDDFNAAYFFLKTGKDQVRIFLKDIIYIEALKDYIKVYTDNRSYIASERLTYMEQKLPESKFSRVHKSYIVSMDRITRYSSDTIFIGTVTIPMGRVYKKDFLKRMGA